MTGLRESESVRLRKIAFWHLRKMMVVYRRFDMKKLRCEIGVFYGAGNGIRTRDICLGKATLYH